MPAKLQWQRKSRKRKAAAATALEAVESFRPRGGRVDANLLVEGDNLSAMSALLRTHAGKVDLIYMDPPFATGTPSFDLRLNIGGHRPSRRKGAVRGRAYGDRWSEGLEDYLQFLHERLLLARALLSPRGTMYVHLDHHVGHYVKVLLDEVMGRDNFRNEVVWCYAGGATPKRDFPKKHDVIFRYTKGGEYTFNVLRRPYGDWTRRFEPRHSLTSGGGGLKKEGTPINDWWADMSKLTSYQGEWLGYPTQKPEALLERVVLSSSNEGDLVLDPFCGSGTTPAVAERLGRRWVAVDSSRLAVHVTRKRLLDLAPAAFDVMRVKGGRGRRHDRAGGKIEATVKVGGRDGRRVEVSLDGFSLPASARLPRDVKRKVRRFTDLVDHWAVDFESGGGGIRPFKLQWWSHRSAKAPALKERASWEYGRGGDLEVRVKVVDILGNETATSLKVGVGRRKRKGKRARRRRAPS